MNFLPAKLENGMLRSPLGEVRLPDDKQSRLESRGDAPREVIMGIRPENFEDAQLIGDKRDKGQTLKATVDVLESLGSDKYAYFTVQGERAVARQLEEVARDAGVDEVSGTHGGIQVTARLDAASKASEDQEIEVWFDLGRVHVFDPDSGDNLTL